MSRCGRVRETAAELTAASEDAEQALNREQNRREHLRHGIPFTLVCLSRGHSYEGCYNDMPCPRCGEQKRIRHMLRDGFERLVPSPKDATSENMRITITGGVTI
jgi:hypothetical protein